jgi:hypothetical protein
MSKQPYSRYGEFSGALDLWERTIAFRVDDPNEVGAKMIVCGACVDACLTNDGRISGGHFLCELCGNALGRSEAFDAAIAKSAGGAQ